MRRPIGESATPAPTYSAFARIVHAAYGMSGTASSDIRMLPSTPAAGQRLEGGVMGTDLRRAGIALFGLALVLMTGCTSRTQVTLASPEQTGIMVSGTGKVTVVPDIGMLQLAVQVTRPAVADARDAAAKAMEAVRASVKQNGVDDKDVATSGFSIQPQYDFRPASGPAITGYMVSNMATIKVRKVDTLSTVLDGAVAAGRNDVRVSSVSFTVDNPEQYKDKARQAAVEDARAHAQQLAKAAGVNLGKARSVSETAANVPVPVIRAAPSVAGAPGAAPETPVSPGQTDVTVTVAVVYEIQ